MFTARLARSRATAIPLALAAAAMGSAAVAEIRDYEFHLIDASPETGAAVIAVRLVNKKTGKSVPDAIIFASRIDMAPDGMPTMASPVEWLPSTEPGVYRLRTNLTMEGGWRLSIAAKVQGETGTLKSKLVLKVAK